MEAHPVEYHHIKQINEEMEGSSTMELLKNQDCRQMQDYMTEKNLEDASLEFRWQTNMLDSRTMRGKYNNTMFHV